MTNPYALFRQTPQQLRRAGARGGKATARNRRARLSTAGPSLEETAAPRTFQGETTAAAITALDVQFPWLRGAETRFRAESDRPAGSRSPGLRLDGSTRHGPRPISQRVV
jgi:hypothetical protein